MDFEDLEKKFFNQNLKGYNIMTNLPYLGYRSSDKFTDK